MVEVVAVQELATFSLETHMSKRMLLLLKVASFLVTLPINLVAEHHCMQQESLVHTEENLHCDHALSYLQPCTGSNAYKKRNRIRGLSLSWDLPGTDKLTLWETCDQEYEC